MTAKQPQLAPAGQQAARPGRAPTVLVVDQDRVSRRFVELALGDGAFTLESASDAASALEIMRTTLVELVIAEAELPDMSGIELHRRIAHARIRELPFVILTSDAHIESKVAALEEGIDDYLVKPCDPAELRARAEARVRAARRRDERGGRRHQIAGDLADLPFVDLVAALAAGRRTGTLDVASVRALAQIAFVDGRVVHAVFGNLAGRVAFEQVAAEAAGQFEFTNDPPAADERTIDLPTHELVEAARRRALAGVPLVPALPAAGSITPIARRPAERPGLAVASQFERGVVDPYALGELHYLPGRDVADWTRRDAVRERFHALLVTDADVGVAAMMAVAGAPGETTLLAGLGATRKLLALAFHLRGDRLLDVLLVDVRRPDQFTDSLERVPSLVILAPRDGGGATIGTRARAELDRLLGELEPTLLLGVGDRALQDCVLELGAVHSGRVPARIIPGELGDASADLRRVLAEGIRAWGLCKPRTP
jgi:DNA-binding response OmpR family regulator